MHTITDPECCSIIFLKFFLLGRLSSNLVLSTTPDGRSENLTEVFEEGSLQWTAYKNFSFCFPTIITPLKLANLNLAVHRIHPLQFL